MKVTFDLEPSEVLTLGIKYQNICDTIDPGLKGERPCDADWWSDLRLCVEADKQVLYRVFEAIDFGPKRTEFAAYLYGAFMDMHGPDEGQSKFKRLCERYNEEQADEEDMNNLLDWARGAFPKESMVAMTAFASTRLPEFSEFLREKGLDVQADALEKNLDEMGRIKPGAEVYCVNGPDAIRNLLARLNGEPDGDQS